MQVRFEDAKCRVHMTHLSYSSIGLTGKSAPHAVLVLLKDETHIVGVAAETRMPQLSINLHQQHAAHVKQSVRQMFT